MQTANLHCKHCGAQQDGGRIGVGVVLEVDPLLVVLPVVCGQFVRSLQCGAVRAPAEQGVGIKAKESRTQT